MYRTGTSSYCFLAETNLRSKLRIKIAEVILVVSTCVTTSAVETVLEQKGLCRGPSITYSSEKLNHLHWFLCYRGYIIRVTDQVVDAPSATAQHFRLRLLNERNHHMNRVVQALRLLLLLGCYMCFPRAWGRHSHSPSPRFFKERHFGCAMEEPRRAQGEVTLLFSCRIQFSWPGLAVSNVSRHHAEPWPLSLPMLCGPEGPQALRRARSGPSSSPGQGLSAVLQGCLSRSSGSQVIWLILT